MGEVGHSYVLVDVALQPDPLTGRPRPDERYCLNWGQGLKFGTNLSMTPQAELPPARIRGERLEADWEGTCSGRELYEFLRRWDGQEYDANPVNHRNCHHFAQEFIHACTAESGLRSPARRVV